jgi:ribosome production factor 2
MGVAAVASGPAGLGASNSLARQPKNRRSKRAAEKRAPKLEENPKSTLLIRGLTTSGVITELLRDLYIVKKPFAKHFSRKNEIRPFEDASSLEFFSLKNDASLFAFGSHSKKRPHNLVLGRMFDHQMLDMCELGISNFQGLAAFAKTARPKEISSRPLMIFDGDGFEHNDNLSKLRSLLLDFFRGAPADKVNLRGIDHAIVCTAVGGEAVTLRTYSIGLKKVRAISLSPEHTHTHARAHTHRAARSMRKIIFATSDIRED